MRTRVLLGAAASLALAAGTRVAAQTSDNQLEEVIVTASKRAETLSRAPLAVSAVGQDMLDRGGVTQVQDLVSQVPNLRPSVNGFSMRGIGSSNSSDQASSTVALHVDGVYTQRSQFLGLPLFDVERVEVLRGPQGTLYGRNATAGVVNIITVQPKNIEEAFGDVSFGNYGERIGRLAINVPVGDQLALRASFVRRANDGYFDTKGATSQNYGKADQTGARLSVKWTPLSSVSWLGTVSYSGDKGTIPAIVARNYAVYSDSDVGDGVLGTVTDIKPTGADPRSGTGFPENNRLDYGELAYRSTLNWAMSDQLSLTWIAGHSRFRDKGRQPVQTGAAFYVDNTAIADSHEMDLKYEGDRVRGVLGLYHYEEDQKNAAMVVTSGVVPYPYSTLQGGTADQPRVANGVTLMSNSPRRTSESQAVFGQVTVELTDKLRLTGGLRYNEDKAANEHQYFKTCVYGSASGPSFSNLCGAALGPQTDIGGLGGKWSNTSWKASVDYDVTEDVLFYATVGTGYRAGGAADKNAPTQYQLFQPEEVTNYEAGIRSLWFDRRVSLNLTAFAMRYKDLQVTSVVQTVAGSAALITTNAAKADINGVEFEGGWKLSPNDKLTGFVTWTDATFGSFPNAANAFLSPDSGYNNFRTAIHLPTLGNPAFDFTGHRLANTPEWTIKGTYAHVFDLGQGGKLTPTVTVYWQSDSYLSAANFAGDHQKAYSRTDLNLLWDAPGDRFTAEAFVNNLENKDVANGYGAQWGLAYVTYARPRLYGLRLGYRF